jgi:hypothetical protein
MYVDPELIADLITEDPNQFNQPQAQQAQPQAQQAKAGNINKREEFMIQLINTAMGSNVPLTAEGYNQIGRSNGFLQEMSKPVAWARLVASDQFSKLASNLSPALKTQILTEMVKSVSR